MAKSEGMPTSLDRRQKELREKELLGCWRGSKQSQRERLTPANKKDTAGRLGAVSKGGLK